MISKDPLYDYLQHKEAVPVHPIVLLNLLELTWVKISKFKYILKTDDYIITCKYDEKDNEFKFERIYNGVMSEITKRLVDNYT